MLGGIATNFMRADSSAACTTDPSCTFRGHLTDPCGCHVRTEPFRHGVRRWDGKCNWGFD